MESFNHNASVLGSMTILLFSFLVMKLYFRIAQNIFTAEGRKRPEVWFAHGIVVGFAAVAVNAFLWKLILRLTQEMGGDTFTLFIYSAGGYFDFAIAIVTAWAAFCHLYSAYLNLHPDHREGWDWLTIAFYPDHNVITRTIHRLVSRVNPGGENAADKEDANPEG
jgi:hypothetical protein